MNETYRVPEGQYLTRFFFGAGDVRSNDKTQGNLIDQVSFSQYRVPTDPEKGTIYVEKNVEGVEQDVTIAAGTYIFEIYENGTKLEDVTLPTEDATLADAAAWSVAVENLTSNTYKVVEKELTNPIEGYQYASTSTDVEGATTETRETKEFLLSQNTTIAVNFTNTYEPATSSLTITKIVAGDDNKAGDFDITVTGPEKLANQVLKDSKGKEVAFDANAQVTVTLGDEESITITGLPRGETYTVQEAESSQGDIDLDNETTAKKDYYLDKTEYQVGDVQSSDTYAQVTLEGDTTVTVTNTYKPYKTLTVEKIVTGEMGSSSDYFDFSAKIDNSSVTLIDQSDDEKTTTEGYDFKLKSGGTVTIVNLKEGDRVTIGEATNDNRGYTAQAPTVNSNVLREKVDGTGDYTVANNNASVEITIPECSSTTDLGTVTFNNHREAVAPTGLESNHTTPYVLMITAAGMAGLVLIGGIVARRIRRRRED